MALADLAVLAYRGTVAPSAPLLAKVKFKLACVAAAPAAGYMFKSFECSCLRINYIHKSVSLRWGPCEAGVAPRGGERGGVGEGGGGRVMRVPSVVPPRGITRTLISS